MIRIVECKKVNTWQHSENNVNCCCDHALNNFDMYYSTCIRMYVCMASICLWNFFRDLHLNFGCSFYIFPRFLINEMPISINNNSLPLFVTDIFSIYSLYEKFHAIFPAMEIYLFPDNASKMDFSLPWIRLLVFFHSKSLSNSIPAKILRSIILRRKKKYIKNHFNWK